MLDNDANPGNDGMELEVENIKSGTPDVTVSTGVMAQSYLRSGERERRA